MTGRGTSKKRNRKLQGVIGTDDVMNKWLSEIEIFATNSFGKKNCRQFVDETRPVVDGVYENLQRNIRSNYGKVVVILWPQSHLDEFSIPPYEYDDMSGVCSINYAYDLNIYLNEDNHKTKLNIVHNILRDAYDNLPEKMGLDGSEVIDIVNYVYAKMSV